jgi:hypothetical protein
MQCRLPALFLTDFFLESLIQFASGAPARRAARLSSYVFLVNQMI